MTEGDKLTFNKTKKKTKVNLMLDTAAEERLRRVADMKTKR